MQKRSGQLGDIFIELGLIDAAAVERALGHQRAAGGYFGDALIHLGLLTPDQVRWGLADQYDIPFVRIRPENIDRATALCVPAAWAREHLVLPVLRDGTSVTVVLADPTAMDRLDEVRRFTGAEHVEAALSTPATLRELIDSVYGEGSGPPVEFAGWVAEAIASGATQVGVSVRGDDARVWAHGERLSSRSLAAGWQAELERSVSRFAPVSGGALREWAAVLATESGAWTVRSRSAGQGRTMEWAARVEAMLPPAFARLPIDADLLGAVRRGIESGGVVCRVLTDAPIAADVLGILIAALPRGFNDTEPRTIHLADPLAAVPPDVLHVGIADSLAHTLERIRSFPCDALTLDTAGAGASDLEIARRIAPLVVVRSADAGTDTTTAELNLCLRDRGGDLVWTLDAANHGTD